MTSGRYYATSGTYSVFGGGDDVAWPSTGLRGSLGPSGPFHHTSCICPWTVVYFEVRTLTAILGSGCDSWVSPVQDNELCFDLALVRDPVVSHTQEYALAHFCDLHCVVDVSTGPPWAPTTVLSAFTAIRLKAILRGMVCGIAIVTPQFMRTVLLSVVFRLAIEASTLRFELGRNM